MKVTKQSFVFTLLNLLSFIPDALMLKLQYFYKVHRWPDIFSHPRFTESMLWYKLYYRNNEMLECTDKYKVREFVQKRLKNDAGKYLNELYQVCDNTHEIDFDSLPNQFVIKTTDGGNGNNVILCKDKDKFNTTEVISEVNSWRNKHYEKASKEWAYSGAESKIIVEQYLSMPENEDGSIDDYKFLCFNGKFKYLWVDKNRFSNHKRGFWDSNLKFLDGVASDHPTFKKPPILPSNIREMIDVAEKLSHGFLFARVDLYNIEGHIYFGEITFYPWGGYVQYTPDSFDFELGGEFNEALKLCDKRFVKN